MPKLKKNKGVTFVRYGGLSPVKQRGFTTDDSKQTFHSPPARKGVYAFPEHWVEMFLLGGNINTFGVRNRVVKVTDKDGNMVTNRHPLFKKLQDRGDKYWDKTEGELWPDAEPDEDGEYSWEDYIHFLTVHQKPRKFTYSGDIWHHLGEHVSKNNIIKQHGSWVLTDIDTYKKSFKREMISRRKNALTDLASFSKNDDKVVDAQFLGRNPYKWHSNDNLEVFIERVK